MNTSTSGQDWRHRAACRDADPQLFETGMSSSGSARSVPAKAYAAAEVCRRCPVRPDCLAFAWSLSGEEPAAAATGTYGGHYFSRGNLSTGRLVVTDLLGTTPAAAVA